MFYFIVGNDAAGKEEAARRLAEQLGLAIETVHDEHVLLAELLVTNDLFSVLAEARKLWVFPACDTWKSAAANWDFLAHHEDVAKAYDACFLLRKKPKTLKQLAPQSDQFMEVTLPEKSWELGKWLDVECRRRSLALSVRGKRMLLERNETAEALRTDLDKIALLGDVDEAHLEQLLPPTPESNYFQFLDDFVRGRQAAALRGLQALLGTEEPVGVLVRLSKQLCLLRSLQEDVRMEGVHPYALRKAREQAELLPRAARYWADALVLLLDSDVRLRAGRSGQSRADCRNVILQVMQLGEIHSPGSSK